MTYQTLIEPTRPVSLGDAMQQWQGLAAQKQEMSLRDMQMQQAQAEAPTKAKMLEAQSQHYQAESEKLQQEAQGKKMQSAAQVSRLIEKSMTPYLGLQQSDPALFQQKLNENSQSYRPFIASVFGIQDDQSKPMSWEHVQQLAQYQGATDAGKVPVGFRANDQGGITPLPVAGYGDYAQYQMDLANGKMQAQKATPGYGEPQKLQMAQEHLDLQRQANERQDANAANSRLENIPATHQLAHISNNTAMSQIDRAIGLAESNKTAFGAKNYMPDAVMQRVDPNGVTARAAVADIGSLKVHDRSGAAVTAAEIPRLVPFIPTATDNDATIVKKLQNLKKEYETINNEFEQVYNMPTYKTHLKPYGAPDGVEQRNLQINNPAEIQALKIQASDNNPDVKGRNQAREVLGAQPGRVMTTEDLLKKYGGK